MLHDLHMNSVARPPLIDYKHAVSKKRIKIKLYDYYFRGTSMPSMTSAVDSRQMRRPLTPVLLAALKKGHPEYASWTVTRFHPEYSLLQYNFIEGGHTPKNWPQFVKAVAIICTAHEAGYIMGDMLAQNVVFHDDEVAATVIDWDMAKAKSDKPKYVLGFVSDGVHRRFRHEGAAPDAAMEFVHDTFALARLAEAWFEGEGLSDWIIELGKCAKVTQELVAKAVALKCTFKATVSPSVPEAVATGSPHERCDTSALGSH